MKACKTCHRIMKAGDHCDLCKAPTLSDDWHGYVVIVDTETSEIGKKLNVTTPGPYALKVR